MLHTHSPYLHIYTPHIQNFEGHKARGGGARRMDLVKEWRVKAPPLLIKAEEKQNESIKVEIKFMRKSNIHTYKNIKLNLIENRRGGGREREREEALHQILTTTS